MQLQNKNQFVKIPENYHKDSYIHNRIYLYVSPGKRTGLLAGSNKGKTWSKEQRDKFSKARLGKKRGPDSEETKKNKKIAALNREEEKRNRKSALTSGADTVTIGADTVTFGADTVTFLG